MGDNVSVEEKNMFEEKLQFVQDIDDSNFGSISIYRFKQPPYEYIMDHQKTFIEGDTRVNTYIQEMKKIKQKQHKNLAKIHMSVAKKENHMCIKDTKVHNYSNYYNFTLQQAIQKKKIKESRFTQSQLSFVLFCLLDVALYLSKNNIAFGQFRPERIFLSPEGYIKIFLFQVDKNNKHTSYYKSLVERSLIDQFILSPEQLSNMMRMEYQPKFDMYKAEVFCIGMVILELLTLDKTKFYYNEDRSTYKMGRINFDLSSFGEEYSQQFLQILRGCLKENPLQRLGLQEAFSYIDSLRKSSSSTSYCLRLHDEQEGTRKSKPVNSTKSQYILNGIQKRLMPSPITTLASSTSSGFKNSVHSIHLKQSHKYK